MTVDDLIAALSQLDDEAFAYVAAALAPRLSGRAVATADLAPGITVVRPMETLAGSTEKPVKTHLLPLPDGRLTRWELAPGLSINPHTHAGNHLWVVLRGSGEMLGSGGVVGEVAPGTVTFSPSGEAHGIRNTGGETLVFLSATLGEETASHSHEHQHDQGLSHSHEHGHDHGHSHGEGHH
jgi:mannose-6-phosphate isomerase-like protein (cupin superfamily)